MLRASEKKKWQRRFASPLVSLILVVLIAFLAPKLWDMHARRALLLEQEQKRSRELADALERKVELERLLDEIKNPAGREALLRERFDVGREGEELLVLVEKTIAATTTPPQPKRWWERLADFVKGGTMDPSRD